MLALAAAEGTLRTAGIRLTPQRLLILQVLVGNRTHPTVEAIFAAVRPTYPTISLATVYHTVALLARYGLVSELHGGKAGLRCDPDTSQHAHAFCEQCGQVFDIPFPPSLTRLSDLKGFTPSKLELTIYGRCPSCIGASPQRSDPGLLAPVK
jgi:Fur family peroxide stress response transcriptional regulator